MKQIRVAMNIVAAAVVMTCAVQAHALTDEAVLDGFNKTVFDSEYSSFSLNKAYVRKFPGNVRMYIRSSSGNKRLAQAQKFAISLNKLIRGLDLQLVKNERQANFVVHLVPRRQYADTVRQNVFKRGNAPVRGKCMVRAVYTKNGISRSDAVIVGDEGDKLFKRCMTEEILQGLGPLNDDQSLTDSMFNDQSRFTSFRRFDRLILNMLYDNRILPGMSQKETEAILPSILRQARRHIDGS